MLQLYKNIKTRREAIGLTQTELAEKMGYADKSMIAKIEAGKVDLSQSKIMAFAEILKVKAGDLMGWDDDEPEQPYYLNPETAQMAQEIYDNPELKILFDASRKATPENLKKATEIINIMTGGDIDYDDTP